MVLVAKDLLRLNHCNELHNNSKLYLFNLFNPCGQKMKRVKQSKVLYCNAVPPDNSHPQHSTIKKYFTFRIYSMELEKLDFEQ